MASPRDISMPTYSVPCTFPTLLLFLYNCSNQKAAHRDSVTAVWSEVAWESQKEQEVQPAEAGGVLCCCRWRPEVQASMRRGRLAEEATASTRTGAAQLASPRRPAH
jgi:hypothetical protein